MMAKKLWLKKKGLSALLGAEEIKEEKRVSKDSLLLLKEEETSQVEGDFVEEEKMKGSKKHVKRESMNFVEAHLGGVEIGDNVEKMETDGEEVEKRKAEEEGKGNESEKGDEEGGHVVFRENKEVGLKRKGCGRKGRKKGWKANNGDRGDEEEKELGGQKTKESTKEVLIGGGFSRTRQSSRNVMLKMELLKEQKLERWSDEDELEKGKGKRKRRRGKKKPVSVEENGDESKEESVQEESCRKKSSKDEEREEEDSVGSGGDFIPAEEKEQEETGKKTRGRRKIKAEKAVGEENMGRPNMIRRLPSSFKAKKMETEKASARVKRDENVRYLDLQKLLLAFMFF